MGGIFYVSSQQQGDEGAPERERLALACSVVFIFIFPCPIPNSTCDSSSPVYKKFLADGYCEVLKAALQRGGQRKASWARTGPSVLSPAWLLFAGGQSTSSLTFLSPTSSSYHITVTKPLLACVLVLFAICLHSRAQGTGHPCLLLGTLWLAGQVA